MSRLRPRVPATLRGRLVAVLAACLAAGFAATAVVLVVVVRHVLIARLDDQLRAAGDRFSVALENGDDDHDGDNRFSAVQGQLAGTLGARIKDGVVTAAAVVAEGERADTVPAGTRARLARITAPFGPETIDLPGLGDYRILVVAGRDGDLQVTGLPATSIEHTITELAWAVTGVFALVLLVVLVLGAAVVRRMLRPLTQFAGTAAQVASLPLSEGSVSLPHRVEESGAGNEIDTLAGAFNHMLDEVQSALETRAASEDRLRRFIADASHELRTPIAVVRGHAEYARRAGGDALPEDLARSLERIAAQSDRMGRLVEDLLLLARLDSGRPLADDDVDIVRVVLDAVDDARTAAADHRWRLALPDEPILVRGDAHALEQVVANLVANAATHTPAGTSVNVGVELLTATTTARLTVSDDGPGIDPELVPRVFDRFVRGGGERATTRGSSGLGLPIVAAIVAAHHGRIDVDSGSSGTTITIELPAVRETPENHGNHSAG